jgi:hypothetical protein
VRSLTCLAVGVITAGHRVWSLHPDISTLEILELVGLNALTPQQAAGYLISPKISTPSPIPTEKVLTSPASPPQLPPVLNSLL